MKTLSFLLAGWILCCNLCACGRKEPGNDVSGSPQNTGSFEVKASPSPVGPTKEIDANQLAFQRDRHEVQVNSALKIVEEELDETNERLKFKISVSYPQFAGPLSPKQMKFNSIISAVAHKEFADYKRGELRPMSNTERFPSYHEDVFEHLYIDYDVPFVNERLINVRFYAATYGRGAAHDVEYFFVFNYDLESGKQIQLSDLFKSRTRYLGSISNYSTDTVKRTLCREGSWGASTFEECLKKVVIWKEGIKPSYENFDAWSITKDGLLFSFDPCQLTGCSGGEYYVVVPYSQIKDLMKPNNVVSKTEPG